MWISEVAYFWYTLHTCAETLFKFTVNLGASLASFRIPFVEIVVTMSFYYWWENTKRVCAHCVTFVSQSNETNEVILSYTWWRGYVFTTITTKWKQAFVSNSVQVIPNDDVAFIQDIPHITIEPFLEFEYPRTLLWTWKCLRIYLNRFKQRRSLDVACKILH